MRLFDLSTDLLQNDERLRIVSGKLYVEKSSVRANSNFFYRLFTRSQYSRSACLAKIHQTAIDAVDKEKFETCANIRKNYQILVDRAQKKDKETKSWFWLTKFFYAKLSVELYPHEHGIKLLDIADNFYQAPSDYTSFSDISKIAKHLRKCKKIGHMLWTDLDKQKKAIKEKFKTKKIAPIQDLGVQVGKGAYALVHKVNALAGKVIPGLAVKLPNPEREEDAKKEIRSEFDFLHELHDSSRITDQEKAELFPRPSTVKYKG